MLYNCVVLNVHTATALSIYIHAAIAVQHCHIMARTIQQSTGTISSTIDHC